MDWQFTALAVPLVVGTALLFGIAISTWRHDPPRGGGLLIALTVALAVYVLGYALELGSTSVEGVRTWLKLQYLGIANVPVLVLAAVLAYKGKRPQLRPAALAWLFVIPALTCVLAFTNEAHELIWRGLRIDRSSGFTRTFFARGAWYWVHNAYVYLLLAAALLELGQAYRGAVGLFRRQTALMLAGLLIPVVVHLVYLTHPVFAGLDPNPFGLLIVAAVLAWGILSYRLWNVVPVAREAVLASMRDAVIVVDGRDRVAELNPAAQELLGLEAAQMIGRPVAEAWPQWSGLPAATSEEALVRGAVAIETRGARRDCEVTLAPLRTLSGEVEGRVLVLHDTTERARVEQLRASLRRMLVHDLRSPLTMIRGTLQTLSDATIPASEETRRVALELAVKHTERLLERVGAILELEQLKSGKLELQRRTCELQELMSEAMGVVRPLARQRDQHVLVELAEDLPPIDVDRDLLVRVLVNLIDNALKFSPDGSCVRVQVRPEPDREALRVEVVDEGPGVDATLQPRVFEEFVTGDSHARGSGLGLAFCRLVIEAHGGRIGVDSVSGKGSCFWFTLPLERSVRR